MVTETPDSILEFSGFRLEPRRRRLTDPDGKVVMLRAREFDTLLLLVQRAGEPVSKDELMAAVWPGVLVEENNLNQAISKLRQALGDDRHDPAFIATLQGRGYQFVAPVSRLATDTQAAADGPRPKEYVRGPWALAAGAFAIVVAVAIAGLLLNQQRSATATFSLDGARLVTQSPASYSMPTLSADGTFMAFVSDLSGTPQIWVQGLPDGKPLQITDGDEPAVSPTWSPADDTILFQRAGPDGVQSVWMTDALRSNPPQLILREAVSPRFVDGNSFTFSRGLNDIYIGSIDGSDVRRIDAIPKTPGFAATDPAMNSDGDIAFVLADEGPSGNLWLYDASTSSARPLTSSSNDFAGVWASSPIWAPDTGSIIFVAADGDPSNTHLWQADVVTDEVTMLSAGVGGYSDAAISADGSRLSYSYSRPLTRLVRTDLGSGEHHVIHESRDRLALPVVSADGKSVVYFFANIYTVPVAGGDPMQLTFRQPGKATLPTWSRSDNQIYYYNERALHRLDPETGASELVLDDFHWSSKNWLAVHGDKIAYGIRGRPVGNERAVVLDLNTGDELTLDEPLQPTDFSRDGRTLLGFRAGDAVLMTCTAPDFDCRPLVHDGEAIAGAIPRWSADESRIFFRRSREGKPGHADIWEVSRDGGEPGRLGEIGPYEPDNMFFGVADDDSIIWNQHDTRGRSEIWVVDVR